MTRFLLIAFLIGYTGFEGVTSWPTQPLLAIVLSMLLFVLMLQWLLLYHLKPQLISRPWFKALTWAGTFAMGLWTTFILLSIPTNLIFLIKYCIELFTTPISIKYFSFDNVNLTLLMISGVISTLGFIEVLRGPSVKRISISLPNLPSDLKNLKIAQISDLHIGPTIGKTYVEKVVKLTNALQPDLIFITGDLADAKTNQIEMQLNMLGQLSARYGAFFVTGNHEYYWDAKDLLDKLEQLNMITLINTHKVISINASKVMIAGITDPMGANMSGHQPDINAALASTETSAIKILLAHRPGVYKIAEKMGVDIQFSGHTHAGQFFPFNILIPIAHKYYKGLNKIGNLWLYVNPGTGYWGPANRFGIPAEISFVKLE